MIWIKLITLETVLGTFKSLLYLWEIVENNALEFREGSRTKIIVEMVFRSELQKHLSDKRPP